MEGELWRIVPGHPKYEISSLGRVRPSALNTKTRAKGFLKTNTWGHRKYLRIALRNDSGGYSYYALSRLVLETFVSPPPTAEHQAAHNDGNPLNNSVSNLRWATPKENTADKYLHGTMRAGESHPLATLTAGAVRNIRKLSGMGFSPREIAELTGRRRKQIENVVYGLSWKCVA